MTTSRDFEIVIRGTREGQPLAPSNFDVDEWIETLQHSRDLLYPDGKKRPRISVKVEEGSVRLILTALAGVVIQTQALLAEVNKTHELALLEPKQRDALRYFQKYALENHATLQLGESAKLDEGLTIESFTAWKEPEKPIWVDAELYITGKITSIGGKTNPNIHIDTQDHGLGGLIVSASEAVLGEDDKNRLYKEQQVRIRLKQNAETGEFDPKSAELIEFIDHEDSGESFDEYLDRLIRQAAPSWADVADPDAWLREIRGYEED